MKKKMFISFLCTILSVSIISSTVVTAEGTQRIVENQVTNKTVSNYEVENFSDDFKVIGHIKSNAITEVEQNSDVISVIITSAEDYYDLNGNFIKAEVKIEEAINDYNTGVLEQTIISQEFETPQTIMNISAPNNFVQPNKMEPTKKEQTIIEKHLALLTNNKANFSVEKQDLDGISKTDLLEIEQIKADIEERAAIQSMEAANDVGTLALRSGAYDNYAVYDGVTGNFTVQALTYSSPHRYWQRTGTTRNNTTNNNAYEAFKNNIDGYERNLQLMEYARFNEVGTWAGFVASVVVFTGTTLTGPAGWAAAIGAAANIVVLLSSYSSATYATKDRAAYSKAAASHLAAAQGTIAYATWSGGTYITVSGF